VLTHLRDGEKNTSGQTDKWIDRRTDIRNRIFFSLKIHTYIQTGSVDLLFREKLTDNLRDGEKNMDGRTDERTNRHREGLQNGRTDGLTDEWTQRGVAESASQISGYPLIASTN